MALRAVFALILGASLLAAVPAAEIFVEGDACGGIGRVYRLSALTRQGLVTMFPGAVLPDTTPDESERRLSVVEAVQPEAGAGAGGVVLGGEQQVRHRRGGGHRRSSSGSAEKAENVRGAAAGCWPAYCLVASTT